MGRREAQSGWDKGGLWKGWGLCPGWDGGCQLCSVPAKRQEPGNARGQQRRSRGGAGSMQGAGSDTNLWPRSPGCVRGKLLARDTGREKRNRESKEGCDSPGVVQDKEGTDGHIPSRRQGVTAWELPGQALNPCLPCRAGMWLGVPCIPTPALRGCCLPWHPPPSTRSPTSRG